MRDPYRRMQIDLGHAVPTFPNVSKVRLRLPEAYGL
jgi:hypothetical protein